jgi:hypothetical protein
MAAPSQPTRLVSYRSIMSYLATGSIGLVRRLLGLQLYRLVHHVTWVRRIGVGATQHVPHPYSPAAALLARALAVVVRRGL